MKIIEKNCIVCNNIHTKKSETCGNKDCHYRLIAIRQVGKKRIPHLHSEETKKKISKTRKERIDSCQIKNWNDGLTKETDNRLKLSGEKISKIHIRDYATGKRIPVKHSEAYKKKLSEKWCSNNPNKTGNNFRNKKHTEKTKKMMSENCHFRKNKGKTNIEIYGIEKAKEIKEKHRLATIGSRHHFYGKKLTREHIRKILLRREMSSLEKKFNDICIRHNLPYKFVGNGKFFIENKNPDFINTIDEKIVIEVYCRKHKKNISGILDIDKWKNERYSLFEKYGYKTLFFDETQIYDDIVLKAIS